MITDYETDRSILYDLTNDKERSLVNGVRNTMIRSENSGNIKGLAEGEIDNRDIMRCNRKRNNDDTCSNESLSRQSSFSSSSSYGEAEVEAYGQFVTSGQTTRKRKAPMMRSSATDNDPGYDTMVAGGKFSSYDDDTEEMPTSGISDDAIKSSRVHDDRNQSGDMDRQDTEFIKGLKCSDVDTALRILTTRYRLRDVRRSASDIHWNMATNFRPSYGRIGSYCRSKRCLYYASEPLQEISKKIFIRDLEIEETLRKILAADGENLEPRHKQLPSLLEVTSDADASSTDDSRIVPQGVLRDGQSKTPRGKHTTFAPNTDNHESNGAGGQRPSDEQDSPQHKKPRRNVLQRAARALRKRLTG